MNSLRLELELLSRNWIAHGLPARETILSTARSLTVLRRQGKAAPLWTPAPRMVTATLDDGIGQGIEIIHTFAEAMDIEVIPLGLLKEPAVITDACQALRPEYAGLTVLQLDSEDDLAAVGRNLPEETRLIAGGPAFRLDPGLAGRCGVWATAAHAAHFIQIVLGDERFAGSGRPSSGKS